MIRVFEIGGVGKSAIAVEESDRVDGRSVAQIMAVSLDVTPMYAPLASPSPFSLRHAVGGGGG